MLFQVSGLCWTLSRAALVPVPSSLKFHGAQQPRRGGRCGSSPAGLQVAQGLRGDVPPPSGGLAAPSESGRAESKFLKYLCVCEFRLFVTGCKKKKNIIKIFVLFLPLPVKYPNLIDGTRGFLKLKVLNILHVIINF